MTLWERDIKLAEEEAKKEEIKMKNNSNNIYENDKKNELLRVEFDQKENIISAKILYQDEKLREDEMIIGNKNYSICSLSKPEIFENMLYIRGYTKSKDEEIFTKTFLTKKEADDWLFNIKSLIDKLNNKKIIKDTIEKADFNNIEKFAAIQEENAELYALKNADYKDSFEKVFKKYGLVTSLIMFEFKLNRLENLNTNENKVKEESIIDTLRDLSNYAIMTIMELDKQTLPVSDKSQQ